jgi:hypothetical protein
MMTAKEQLLLLPLVSLVRQTTMLVATPKVDPLGGEQTIVRLVPSQLSLAVVTNVTLLREHWPAFATSTRLVEQFMAGGSKSCTVTVNEHVLVLAAASTTEQVTLVVPFAKVDPLGKLHTTVRFVVQLSVAVTV